MTENKQQSRSQPDQSQDSSYYHEEETTLPDIIAIVARKKLQTVIIASIFTLLSIIYAQSITPTYQATIGFLEPQEVFLSQLPPDIAKYLPGSTIIGKKVPILIQINPVPYSRFLSKIGSYDLKRTVFENGDFFKKFYGDNNAVDIDHAVFKIHNSIKIINPNDPNKKQKFEKPIYLQMKGPKPEAMSEFLTALAKYTKQNVVNEIRDLARSVITTKINEISREITGLRLATKKKRENKVMIFSEALDLAKFLGIKNGNFMPNNSKQNSSPTAIRNGNSQLKNWFLYGEKPLQQALSTLKSRKNSDAFVKGLINKETELFKYKSIDLSMIAPIVYLPSQPSIAPIHPIEPNKPLIIAIGLGLGFIIGVFAAFFSISMELSREKKTSFNSL